MKKIRILLLTTIIQFLLFITLLIVPSYSLIVATIFSVISVGITLHIFNDDSRLTSSKLSWIAIVLILPIIGVILYLVYGLGHMNDYRQKILMNSKLRYSIEEKYRISCNDLSSRKQSLVNYLDRMKYSTSYVHKGGNFDCYTNGVDKFNQLLIDIEEATSYIHLEYYIIKEGVLLDKIEEVLTKKVAQGIEVRIMGDFLGCYQLSDNFIERVRAKGIKIAFFNKPRFNLISKISNFRNHRKIIVIDGLIAYTGGFNIGDEYVNLNTYYNVWKDFHLRISNSSSVLEYETFFAQTWFFETGENLFNDKYYPQYEDDKDVGDTYIYPYVDGPDSVETYIRDMYIKAVMLAKHTIIIATPYFIPDTVLLDAIMIQANSGVNVILITPGLPDKKFVKLVTESFYPNLLKAGVKIYEYNGFIHSKKILIDDDIAIVGTANFDMRSFNLSFESCTLLFNGKVISDIKRTFQHEIINSSYFKITNLQNDKIIKKVAKLILRLFSPLF